MTPHLNLKQRFADTRQLKRAVGLSFQGQQHRALGMPATRPACCRWLPRPMLKADDAAKRLMHTCEPFFTPS